MPYNFQRENVYDRSQQVREGFSECLKWEFVTISVQDVLGISMYGCAGFGALQQLWVSLVNDLFWPCPERRCFVIDMCQFF